MDDLITRYGLVGVFFGAAIEGDITLILAGITGALGLLNLPLGLAVGVAGAVSGDVLWYAAGRWRSSAIRSSLFVSAGEPVVERLVGRLGPWQIVVSQLSLRHPRSHHALSGGPQLSLKRFLFLRSRRMYLWAAILGTLGYVGGHSAKRSWERYPRRDGCSARSWLSCCSLRFAGGSGEGRYALDVALRPGTRRLQYWET